THAMIAQLSSRRLLYCLRIPGFHLLGIQDFVEFENIQVGITDEADVSASMTKLCGTFLDFNVFTIKPGYKLIHAVDNKGRVRVAGALDWRIQQHVAFSGRFAVEDQVYPQASRVYQSAGLVLWRELIRVANKTQFGIKSLRPGQVGDANADMIKVKSVKTHKNSRSNLRKKCAQITGTQAVIPAPAD